MYTALTEVIREEFPAGKVFSDIGCYTLGWLAPFHAIDTCVDMGASITMAKGAADAGQHPAVAVIGDSTFTHSGMTGLLDAVNEGANITVIISDNLTTGMTGGQDSAGTGRLEQICAGIGVDPAHIRTVVPLPKNREELKRMIREEIAYRGVSVIIPRRECIQTAKRHAAAKNNDPGEATSAPRSRPMPFRSATPGAQPPGRAPDDGRSPEEGLPDGSGKRQRTATGGNRERKTAENSERHRKAATSCGRERKTTKTPLACGHPARRSGTTQRSGTSQTEKHQTNRT